MAVATTDDHSRSTPGGNRIPDFQRGAGSLVHEERAAPVNSFEKEGRRWLRKPRREAAALRVFALLRYPQRHMERTPLDLTPELATTTDRLGREFMLAILEVETARHPENVEALAELGHAYTREGRHLDGLRIDRKLARLIPDDPTVHYNLACSLALLGRLDAALDALEESIGLGYADPEFMAKDEDLSSLRGDSRYETLLHSLTHRA